MPDPSHEIAARSSPCATVALRSIAVAMALGVVPAVPSALAQEQGERGVDDGIAVRVDGRPITSTTVETVMAQIERSGGEGDRDAVIGELIDLDLIGAAALATGLDRQPGVRAKLDLARARTLANAWLDAASSGMMLSDDELLAAYDDQVAGLPPEQFQASHILLETRTQALEVLARLADGADWNELAAARSIDASGRNGGSLGWFDAVSMEPDIVSAVGTLEPGTVAAEPVRTNFGFHVVRLDGRRAGARPDFFAVRPALRDIVLRARLAERLARMRGAAIIEWPDGERSGSAVEAGGS